MDIYKEITDRIIAQMEQGVIPWHKPWVSHSAAVSHVTRKPYSLLNQMLLACPGEYVTFNECRKEGGSVRKGEKAHMVVFWKFLEKENEETHEMESVPFLRYYSVFHISQCEGLKPRYTEPFPGTADPDEAAEAIIHDYLEREKVKLNFTEGDQAFYQPAADAITVPFLHQYAETAEYYSTVFHEMTHSTGHMTRLNRLDKVVCFGSEEYSKEELIAEIGAAALVNQAGLETEKSFRNSAAYLQSWLQVLKDDKRFIVSAASKAEKAVAFILGA